MAPTRFARFVFAFFGNAERFERSHASRNDKGARCARCVMRVDRTAFVRLQTNLFWRWCKFLQRSASDQRRVFGTSRFHRPTDLSRQKWQG